LINDATHLNTCRNNLDQYLYIESYPNAHPRVSDEGFAFVQRREPGVGKLGQRLSLAVCRVSSVRPNLVFTWVLHAGIGGDVFLVPALSPHDSEQRCFCETGAIDINLRQHVFMKGYITAAAG
jgi:hypothetical protein